jgi:hypothetical protein
MHLTRDNIIKYQMRERLFFVIFCVPTCSFVSGKDFVNEFALGCQGSPSLYDSSRKFVWMNCRNVNVRKASTICTRGRSVYIGLNGLKFVGIEVLTTVVMKSHISWDTTPCGSLKVNRFRRNIGPIFSRSKNKPSFATCFMLLLAWIIFRPYRWRGYIPPKRRLTFNALQCNLLH